MQLVLYNCTAENNRVDKTAYLSNQFLLKGTIRDHSSIINPQITIEKTNPTYYGYNYMYIPDFKRYYFIKNFTQVTNKLWLIDAHVDVLYTWRASITQMKAVIDKSQLLSESNLYMDDGSFVMESRKYITVYPFPNGLDEDGEFILICAGGQGGGS